MVTVVFGAIAACLGCASDVDAENFAVDAGAMHTDAACVVAVKK